MSNENACEDIPKTKHQIGLIGATCYMVNVIGSGIFVTPNTIFRQTQSVGLSLLIWLIAGIVSTFGALSYAELGTTIQTSGADFSYMIHVKWYSLAFAVVIVGSLINYPCIVAIQIQTFSAYLMQGLNMGKIQNEWYARKLIEICLLWMIIFINCFSLRKVAGKFNIISSFAKILVISIILAFGAIYLFKGNVKNFEHPFHTEHKIQASGLVGAFFAALFTYDGWDVLNFGAEEIKNPRRTMPLAVLIGMTIVGGIYFLTNCAYFLVLDKSSFLYSNAIANDFANETMGKVAFLVPLFICVLMIGAVNSTIFSASRFLYAAAKKGYLPTFISVMNVKNKSPRAALIFHSLLVICMNFYGEVDELINYCVFAQWTQRSATILILFYLRYKSKGNEVENENLVRMPLPIPIIFFATCSSLILFALIKTFELAAITVFVFICTMIIYYLFFWKRLLSDFNALRVIDHYITVAMQFLFNAMPQLDKIDVCKKRKIHVAKRSIANVFDK